MRFPTRGLRDRLVPALLTAAGVTLLAAGLLHYGDPVQAGPIVAGPSGSPVAGRSPSPFVVPSLPPIDGSAGPGPSASADPNRVATRVVIEALGIDLPVIIQPNDNYPACNVAMYLQASGLGQPGGARSIYLYAHARPGMFGPLYERVTLGRSGGPSSLKNMVVQVFTSDDFVYEYAITKILPRVKADSHFLDGPLAVKGETLWLQTSTGPNGTYPKLQVIAEPFYVAAVAHAQAHPKPHPIACG